jgi:hypothetical protein
LDAFQVAQDCWKIDSGFAASLLMGPNLTGAQRDGRISSPRDIARANLQGISRQAKRQASGIEEEAWPRQ